MTFSSAPRERALSLRPLVACVAMAITCCAFGSGSTSERATLSNDRLDLSGIISATHSANSTALPSVASIVVVKNCNDSGPDSLRDALIHAVNEETIDLTQLTCSRITLTSELTVPSSITQDLYLQGPGRDRLVIDGDNKSRILHHTGLGRLQVSGVSITNGHQQGYMGGGCVYSKGSLTLIDSTISSCSSTSASSKYTARGGAIVALAPLTLSASTVKDSTAHCTVQQCVGGGIWGESVTLMFSTVSGNTVSTDDQTKKAIGGGIYAQNELRAGYSTISNNQALSGAAGATGHGSGGGVFVRGTAYIYATTISANAATQTGGGIYIISSSTIFNSTIAKNSAGDVGGGSGIYLLDDMQLDSTIIADNGLNGIEDDVGGLQSAHIVGSRNLIMASGLAVPADTLAQDPHLGPLQNNGGATKTHALLADSAAIDHGSNTHRLSKDQTGMYRESGNSADIGAFEFQDGIFQDTFEVSQIQDEESMPFASTEGIYNGSSMHRVLVSACQKRTHKFVERQLVHLRSNESLV